MSDAATPQPVLADVEDFLAWVQGKRERYEFVGGHLVVKAGGSEDHNDIQANLLAALKRRLRGGPCKPNGSDLLVRIDERTGRFPDASATCGP
jgi:Uma2 family endonuclease